MSRSSHGIKLTAFVLLAVLVMALSACGSQATQSAPTAPTTTIAPVKPIATTASPEPTAQPLSTGEAVISDTSYAATSCEYGGILKSIAILDSYTIKFTLCTSDAAFPAKVAFSTFGIYPSEYLEATGGGGQLVISPIGTGPYKLEKWVKGDSIIFKRNDEYWGEKAKAETLVFRWQNEGTARLLELQAGAADGIDNPNPDDFATIAGDANLALIPREALNIFYIGMNRDKAPLDNEQVRLALAVGIDRQRIVDSFYPEGSIVASHFTPCAIPGGCEGEEWYEFDPVSARQMLADAGFANGFEIELAYRDVFRDYLSKPALVAQDIQAQLKENLGVTANIQAMESGAFVDASYAGVLSLHLSGWGWSVALGANYPDQTNFLDSHFGAGAAGQFGAGFEDIYAKLQEAASLADPAERNMMYAQANNLIKQHVPMIPVAHSGSAAAFRVDVAGAHASPLGNEHFASMDPDGRQTLVWMQNAEPIGLYCADEVDSESLRGCGQINESLLAYEIGGAAVKPSLAKSYEVNKDLTEWTFNLRKGVKFHDGSDFDARDVLLSYAMQWDAQHPLHVGREGSFTYFASLFGQFLNVPKE